MFDAILLASYGGPENLNEIEPFLDRILTGKRVPPARRAAVVERYRSRGGVSPLPGECRRFLEKLRGQFAESDAAPRVYWGNLFAPPFFDDALTAAEADGVRSLLVFPMSAFGSPASCRRYVDAVREAASRRSPEFRESLKIAQIPPFFDWTPFRRALADEILTALAWDALETPAPFDENAEPPRRLILFSAHSIPVDDAKNSRYFAQLLAASSDVLRFILDAPAFGGALANEKTSQPMQKPQTAPFLQSSVPLQLPESADFAPELRERLRENSLDAALAFQSRSGSPTARWLEPSVSDVVRRFRAESPESGRVVVVPIGFFFENLETFFDLDVELRGVCDEIGLSYRRAACCGNAERIVRAVAELSRRDATDFPVCRCKPGECDFSCRLR